MALNFDELLTVEQKRSIISNKITEFAAQAYQIALNKKTLEDSASEEQLEAIDRDTALLEKAIATYQAELDSLPEE